MKPFPARKELRPLKGYFMRAFLCSALLAGSSLFSTVSPAAAQPVEAPKTLSAEEAAADLDQLYAGLRSAEADLFKSTPRSVFDARFDELKDSFSGPVSLTRLHAVFQKFAALARHSHTRIDSLNPGWTDHVSAGGLIFPLTFLVENGEVIVSGAPEGSGVEPGDRILSIDGEPNPIWLSRVKAFVSAETPEFAYAQMVGGEPYFMWLAYGSKNQFSVGIERGSASSTMVLDAIPIEAFSDLVTHVPGFSLEGRDARMLNDSVAYLRPGPSFNLDAATPEDSYAPEALAIYTAFIDAAFEDFIARGADHLVLDLRDNPGGDNSYTDPVIAWFADKPFRFASDFLIRVSPETIASNQSRLDAQQGDADNLSAKLAELYVDSEPGSLVSFDVPCVQPHAEPRFHGQVHVLVNRYSYSNAVTTTALIQDYGFGTIYGETTRDMATTFGAMEHFTLSHSGFSVGYPKARIIRPNGEKRLHPVTPDVTLQAPLFRGSQDVMLDALLERLEARKK
ncbi:S41 family peptidase [Hyphomonas sp. GM-8P]|uniref:S41 family peptidase n=1 Tax=Hyphomonas sp. GM-8P TaxID=1280945 RepID=UPI000DBFA326|nr:S41 family peptidase [Hyphomonas sp. GM-8P]RAN41224.1 hypothetical protein HY26_10130 [Hyphomonas sp. GM-8P]